MNHQKVVTVTASVLALRTFSLFGFEARFCLLSLKKTDTEVITLRVIVDVHPQHFQALNRYKHSQKMAVRNFAVLVSSFFL